MSAYAIAAELEIEGRAYDARQQYKEAGYPELTKPMAEIAGNVMNVAIHVAVPDDAAPDLVENFKRDFTAWIKEQCRWGVNVSVTKDYAPSWKLPPLRVTSLIVYYDNRHFQVTTLQDMRLRQAIKEVALAILEAQ